jgi:5-methylcytosine-specific restriction endonuclease McrA
MAGKNNPRWGGGVSPYPNHSLMKKNRLIVLINNPICEICGKTQAQQIHHKNRDRSDHRLSNLMGVCCSCHSGLGHKGKYQKLYGKNRIEIAKILNTYPGWVTVHQDELPKLLL